MLGTHVTREGDTMLIAQMTDFHLRAFIRLVLRQVRAARESSHNSTFDPYQAALYGIKIQKPKDAAKMSREAIEKLYPYLTEAYLRGFDDIRAELIDVAGRSDAIPNGLPTLPAQTIYFDDSDIPF